MTRLWPPNIGLPRFRRMKFPRVKPTTRAVSIVEFLREGPDDENRRFEEKLLDGLVDI